MDVYFMEKEHRLLKSSVYEWARDYLGPIAEEIDRSDKFPDDIFKQMGELGILGITIPQEYGGAGMDILSALIVVEEIARFSPAVALSYGAHAILCADNIYRNGTEEQRQKYLPPLCSGDKVGAMALTEPGAGSDAVSISTKATFKENCYLLEGSKTFITNGPIADTLVVYAKTRPELGSKGISAFIVEKEFPGFSVSRTLEKMGMRGSPTGELFFDKCVVPKENLLGKENQGVAVMMSGLDIERVFFSGLAIGLAQGAFDHSVKYAKERVQFGKPIGNFQLIQSKLADMYTQIESSRIFSYHVARFATDKKKKGHRELHKKAAASVLYAGEMCNYVASEAVQIHGGYGYTLEFPVQRLMRDAKLMTIGAGTSEIRRLIVAREILKLS